MVDALREAIRVLTPSGVLIDLRPLTVPFLAEVALADQAVWAQTVESYSVPQDVSAADAAVQYAVSKGWISFETSRPFPFDIYCDSSAEFIAYAEERKLRGAEIPAQELERVRQDLGVQARASRFRCRRQWMLSVYRKN